MKTTKSILFIILIFVVHHTFAQTAVVDSLENLLKLHKKEDTLRVNLLNDLALKVYSTDLNKTLQYATQADSLSLIIGFTKGSAEGNRMKGFFYLFSGDYLTAIEKFEKALELYTIIDNKLGIGKCYGNIAKANELLSNFAKALEYNYKALDIFIELDIKQGLKVCYISIGNLYTNFGDYQNSLENHLKSLKIAEELKDTLGMADSYNNIGLVYFHIKDYKKSLEYYNLALEINQKAKLKVGIGINFANIGMIYFELKNYEKALEYSEKSADINEELDNKYNLSINYDYIGGVYFALNNYEKAFEYYEKSLTLNEELGNKRGIADVYIKYSEAYYKLKQYQKSIEYGEKGYAIAFEIGEKEIIVTGSNSLSKSYAITGNYAKAYQYNKINADYKDSLYNDESIKKITSLELTYKFEKQKQADKLEQEKKDAVQAEKDRKKNILILVISSSLVVFIILAIIIFKLFLDKKKTNTILRQQKSEIEDKNEELIQQKEEIQTQNEQLEYANREITNQKQIIEQSLENIGSSISYASKIQKAILPQIEIFNNFFADNFIFFKPRDVVSGDFYFIKKINNHFVIAAADCTGHGIPGAFMSVLGISLLNEIVAKREITSTSQVLNELRTQIKISLQQSGEKGEQQDGMDIAFCAINIETQQLHFAGAYNPCWIFRNENKQNTLIELPADRMPVGVFIKEKDFSEQIFQLQKGDNLYLFSDGYSSQFGGNNDSKYNKKRMKEFLQSISSKPMNEQKELLELDFNNWKGNNEQTDDILLIGIKI